MSIRSWNDRYQSLILQTPNGAENAMKIDVQICELIGQFHEVAVQKVKGIVDQYHIKSNDSQNEDGLPYSVCSDGIVFQFACNYHGIS